MRPAKDDNYVGSDHFTRPQTTGFGSANEWVVGSSLEDGGGFVLHVEGDKGRISWTPGYIGANNYRPAYEIECQIFGESYRPVALDISSMTTGEIVELLMQPGHSNYGEYGYNQLSRSVTTEAQVAIEDRLKNFFSEERDANGKLYYEEGCQSIMWRSSYAIYDQADNLLGYKSTAYCEQYFEESPKPEYGWYYPRRYHRSIRNVVFNNSTELEVLNESIASKAERNRNDYYTTNGERIYIPREPNSPTPSDGPSR